MIPDDEVDRVLDAADVIAVIGERVRLKRVGNSWRGPCPFHHGKGDNFSVMPGRGYRCWVCGETGSVFTFVQKQLGLDFVEAVKYVGQKFGVTVREVSRREEGTDPREPLWEVVAAAAEFFQRTLWDDADGRAARDYLASRSIVRDVAERFMLGASPRDGRALTAHLESLGHPVERQVEAGVLKRVEGEGVRPRFWGRLMFPIHDARGRAVGFGARALDGSEPKYINSSESSIYSKGELLYHLHEARFAIRKSGRVVLVEGYFDVVRTAAAGIDEVVAPLGTALTPQQAALIRRYSPTVYLLYDSDTAGLKATFRAGDALLRERASVQVVTLPDGEDPDTFVTKAGAAGLEKAIADAVDVFERKLQLLQRGGWFADLARARRAIDKLLPTIRNAADPVLRDLYLTRASQQSGVDRDTLAREVASLPAGGDFGHGTRQSERPRESAPGRSPTEGDRGGRGPQRPGAEAERTLVRAMLAAPERADHITEALGHIDDEASTTDPAALPTLRDAHLRAIQQAVLDAGDSSDIVTISAALPEAAIPVLESLLAEQESIVKLDATIADALAMLRARWRQERIAALRSAEGGGAGVGDPDALNREILRLKKEIQGVRGPPR